MNPELRKRMKTQAIIAAAGKGERLGTDVAKPFVVLNQQHPLVMYSLMIFEQCEAIDSVIIAADADKIDKMNQLVAKEGLRKVKHIVAGGSTRAHSVKNCLAVLDEDTECVVIHDGARPLITVDFVRQMISSCTDDVPALIAAVPVKPTIKQVDPDTLCVRQTLDRSCLWDIQTPQVFKRNILDEAYQVKHIQATDDAALVERMGKPVKVFPGLEQNIKVTTPQDLFFVEKFLGAQG